jgi:dihydrodipicolinate synthase/N-acetylneuraminate lyase
LIRARLVLNYLTLKAAQLGTPFLVKALLSSMWPFYKLNTNDYHQADHFESFLRVPTATWFDMIAYYIPQETRATLTRELAAKADATPQVEAALQSLVDAITV